MYKSLKAFKCARTNYDIDYSLWWGSSYLWNTYPNLFIVNDLLYLKTKFNSKFGKLG
jgi:hypothetical protein